MDRVKFMAFTVNVEQTSSPVAVFVWSLSLRVRVDAVTLVGLMRFNVDTVTVELMITVLKKAAEVCCVANENVEIKREPVPVNVEAALT
jgi:hypothetical protein